MENGADDIRGTQAASGSGFIEIRAGRIGGAHPIRPARKD